MSKNTRFLTLFSFAGYFLVQLLIKSIGPPLSIVRNFWTSMHFDIAFNFDIAAARTSLINTVFYIAVISLFLFTIKRIRDNGNVDALKTVLYVILSTVVFLLVDMAVTYLASVIIATGSITLYNWLINILIVLSSLLYIVSLVAIVNEGKFTWHSYKRVFSIRGYGVVFLIAATLRAIPQILPYISQKLALSTYWAGVGAPLVVSFVFLILMKPAFIVEN